MGFAAHRAQVEASFPINRIPDDFTTLPVEAVLAELESLGYVE